MVLIHDMELHRKLLPFKAAILPSQGAEMATKPFKYVNLQRTQSHEAWVTTHTA